LLEEKGRFLCSCFSSNGSLFAASKGNTVYIWKHTFGGYTQEKEIWCQDSINSLQFSPTSSSILSHSKNVLQVWRLRNPPANPKTRRQQRTALSRSGRRVAISHQFGTIITILDPHSHGPPLLIHTGVAIEGFLLTSNVLLVVGLGQVVAWLIVEEGLLNGALDGRMLNCSDRLWVISLTSPNRSDNTLAGSYPRPKPKLALHVEGQIAVITNDTNGFFLYHTETGEVLEAPQTPPRRSGPWLDLATGLCGRHHHYCHNLPQFNTPSESGWRPSEATLRDGWVKDPEGRHRLWLHVEWRKSWDLADWCHDITTQSGIIEGQSVIVKF